MASSWERRDENKEERLYNALGATLNRLIEAEGASNAVIAQGCGEFFAQVLAALSVESGDTHEQLEQRLAIATIGFGEFSITVSTSCRPGGFGGLPNSVMSAPAMKVRPPQVKTIALISRSAIAFFMHSRMPPRTAALSALTGGLSTVTMPTTS